MDVNLPQVPLADATRDQLHRFAAMILGLELSGRPQRDTLLAKIAESGYTRDVIPDMPAPAAPTPANDMGMQVYKYEGREFTNILISIDENPGGDRPVPVQVNGKLMYIPRGKIVGVPVEYALNLNDAVQYKYEQGSTNQETGDTAPLSAPREVHSYPFSFQSAAARAEMPRAKAWTTPAVA